MDAKEIWATNLAQQIKSRQENEERQRKQHQMDQELISNRAPGLWAALQNEVQAAMHALNTALGQGTPLQLKESENNKFELFLQKGGRRIFFTFEPYTSPPKVSIVTINSSLEYEINVENGEAVWVSRQVGKKSSEQIAKDVLADTAKFI